MKVVLLSPKEFDRRFQKKIKKKGYVGVGTSLIFKKAPPRIYIKDVGDDQYISGVWEHEVKEIEIFQELLKKGVKPEKAVKLAHKMNPIKI